MEMVDALLRHLHRKGRAAPTAARATAAVAAIQLPRRLPAELRSLVRALAVGRDADLGDWQLDVRALAPGDAALATMNAQLEPDLRVATARAAVIGASVDGAALVATWGHDGDDGHATDGDDVIARSWSPWRDEPVGEVLLIAIDEHARDGGYAELGTLDELIADALEHVSDGHEATPDLRAIASLIG